MEIDELDERERGMKGFGSTDLSPKRLITTKETKITICFLNPNPEYNEDHDDEDSETNPRRGQEVAMLSNAIIAAVHMQTMDQSFLNRIRMAGIEDDTWLARKEELSRLKESSKALPKHRDIEDGLLYYKDRLFIPANEDLLTEKTKGCDDSKVGGHFGEEKTIELVTRNFYWKNLTDWINDYVRSCDECQHNKSPRHAKYGLLQPLEVPYAAWTSISTDFITQLPESQGYTKIMAVVDGFTKIGHFIGLATNATAKDVADTFLREVSRRHGLPSEIILDKDVKFASEFWKSLSKSLGIK